MIDDQVDEEFLVVLFYFFVFSFNRYVIIILNLSGSTVLIVLWDIVFCLFIRNL